MLQISNAKQDVLSADVFGGKAHGLHMLAQSDYNIPESIVIQATANVNDMDDIEFQNELRNKLAPFEINGKYDLAVRSSCTSEDSFTNSMAGHFASFLGIMSFDDVLANAKRIINGLNNTNSSFGKMGIIIQPKIKADYSGVIFSSDPISYSKKQMLITYTNGISDKMVSGEVAGKDIIVNIENDKYIFSDSAEIPFINLLTVLAEKSKHLEDKLRYPLDIEWAVVGSEIYFLQCRPLTSITSVPSILSVIDEQSLSGLPTQITSHDKIKLRLIANKSNVFISDAYVYVKNSCNDFDISLNFSRSVYCKGYSAVICYPQKLSNKVIRSFVGDKMKVFGNVTGCCRYGIRSFPEYENLESCLSEYTQKIDNEYWISAIIIQEIFDPIYTGVIQRVADGFIIEITRGHFLTKGVVPTSQYIISTDGKIIERNEIWQRTWLKIIEGHVVYCVCNNDDEGLVSLDDNNLKNITEIFNPVLRADSNVVEFGLLSQPNGDLMPYLIDFVDDNSPINISISDIKNGVISYGYIKGKPIVIENLNSDSLNEHFHNTFDEIPKSEKNEKIIFICKNPELALLNLIDKFEPKNIGFVFENCAIGAHISVVLREKGIPAIKAQISIYDLFHKNFCTIDAKTPGLLPKERLIYE